MKKKIEYIVLIFLEWIDNNINHRFIDPLMNYFPMDNKDGSDSLAYIFWEKTSNKYCNFVMNLYDKWNL